MTREEEINKASYAYWVNNYANIEFIDEEEKEFHTQDIQDSFINGAEWADQHPHWISVEEELPPMRNEDGMSDKVLTHSKGGVIYMNRYDYRGNTWGNPLAFNVTHWMPMPSVEHLKDK